MADPELEAGKQSRPVRDLLIRLLDEGWTDAPEMSAIPYLRTL